MIVDLDDVVVPTGQHVVQFYERDEALVLAVGSFLGAGLVAGEAAVVVATANHRAAFEAVLCAAGVDVAALGAAGRYVGLDAEELLGSFLVDGRPDAARFQAQVGDRVAALASRGVPVRIVGEMVALLWARGDVAEAITLEELWNDLAAQTEFTLFCGYPRGAMAGPSGEAICAHHSHVVPEPRRLASPPGEALQRFEPTPFAVPVARRFVTDTLRAWGRTTSLDAVELVVTELVGNAVRHGGRRFAVSVTAREDHVRVAVTDSCPERPRLRSDDPASTGGRGMRLVTRLSRRWGTEQHSAGKTVWADVDDAPH